MFSKRVESYKDIEMASDAAILEFINGLANNTSDYVSRWEGWEYYSCNFLKDSAISECTCLDSSHDRCTTGNSRVSTEEAIVHQALKISKSGTSTLKILSMGAGDYLQDLIILCRLIASGMAIKNFDLVCVDPLSNPDYPGNAWVNQIFAEHKKRNDNSRLSYGGQRERELVNIIDKINKTIGCNIRVSFYKSIENIPENSSFDVVYAIDYDCLRLGGDHSDDKLINDEYYKALIALMKSLTLLKEDPGAFAAFSIHEQINWFTSSELSPSHQSLPCLSANNIYDCYCFNASLAPFFYYLPFFIAQKKPLIFNEAIVNPQDKALLVSLLNKFELPYTFYGKDKPLKNNGLTFVVETRFVKNHCPVPFEHDISVMKYDNEINKFKSVPCHIQVQAESLTKDAELKQLLKKPCLIRRLDNYFFEESLSLGNYLIGLAAKSMEGAHKAQRIIYHLKNREFDLVATELAVHRNPGDCGTTTGTKIWNILINTGLVESKPEHLKIL